MAVQPSPENGEHLLLVDRIWDDLRAAQNGHEGRVIDSARLLAYDIGRIAEEGAAIHDGTEDRAPVKEAILCLAGMVSQIVEQTGSEKDINPITASVSVDQGTYFRAMLMGANANGQPLVGEWKGVSITFQPGMSIEECRKTYRANDPTNRY